MAWSWASFLYLTLCVILAANSTLHAYLYWASRRLKPPSGPVASGLLPRVTVQLPLYNERYVAARLLEHVARLDYPRELLQVQVLDDSTDETSAIVSERSAALKAAGLDIQHLRREQRRGFKAGALARGLETASGEVVLLLDADFMPAADLLRRLVPHFADASVAAVQARWTHANLRQSLLTRMQGLFIDFHFEVEQAGRQRLGCFVNFNGTAGMWRVSAIHAVGGWSAETLTEDVDLSYRAQLEGWKIVFCPEIEAPAELPADLRAFRVQQFRWMKGLAQNARRLLPQVLTARLPLRVKAHACAHLVESSLFVILLALTLYTPVLADAVAAGQVSPWIVLNPAWLLNMFLAPIYFSSGAERLSGISGWLRAFALWIAFLALSFGLALHNSVAVLTGMLGQRSEFVRTPKAGDGVAIARGAYRISSREPILLLEALLWVYLVGALVRAAHRGALYAMWAPLLSAIGLTAILAATLAPRSARG